MAPVAMAAATGIKAVGQLAEGEAAEAAGKFKARQERRNAKNALAEGIRESGNIRRQGEITQGNAAAAMGASGGVTDDVGAIKTMADIESITNYNAATAIYGGRQRQQNLNLQARMSARAGKDAKNASRMKAIGTVISGGSNAYRMGKT